MVFGVMSVRSVQDRAPARVYNASMSETIILPPGAGRADEIGPMRGVFKADEEGYCASEWSVARMGPGPARTATGAGRGVHRHRGDDVVSGRRGLGRGAEPGTFLRIPAQVTHDFENRGDTRAAAFNVFVPGHHFEARFAAWAS